LLAVDVAVDPGANVVFRQPGNDQARLNIRGSGLQQNPVQRGVRLLLDGLPVNLADGSFIIGVLEPRTTQYIEVYRGANGARYGATTPGGGRAGS
jgi:iron complex outermembrane receptor protein